LKRSSALAFGLLSLVTLAGCPLSTNEPLAEPRADLRDDRLVGEWIGEEDEDDPYGIVVLPFNDAEYYVEVHDDEEPTRFRVYLFAAGDERFLHVEELSETRDHPEYVFARYEMPDGSHLTVRLVGDELVSGDVEPEALRDFLAKNAEDPGLYGNEDMLVFRRL